jgi:hypothetical protein
MAGGGGREREQRMKCCEGDVMTVGALAGVLRPGGRGGRNNAQRGSQQAPPEVWRLAVAELVMALAPPCKAGPQSAHQQWCQQQITCRQLRWQACMQACRRSRAARSAGAHGMQRSFTIAAQVAPIDRLLALCALQYTKKGEQCSVHGGAPKALHGRQFQGLCGQAGRQAERMAGRAGGKAGRQMGRESGRSCGPSPCSRGSTCSCHLRSSRACCTPLGTLTVVGSRCCRRHAKQRCMVGARMGECVGRLGRRERNVCCVMVHPATNLEGIFKNAQLQTRQIKVGAPSPLLPANPPTPPGRPSWPTCAQSL